jgi:hypothetical protein
MGMGWKMTATRRHPVLIRLPLPPGGMLDPERDAALNEIEVSEADYHMIEVFGDTVHRIHS